MPTPTHVQVTVCRARELLITKEKSGKDSNSSSSPKCSVKVSLGEKHFHTEKIPWNHSLSNLEWDETCELPIPPLGEGLKARIITLTILLQNSSGVEECLGVVTLPLSQLIDVKDKSQGKWHSLKSDKPEKKKSPKNLGEIEVKVNFSDRPILKSDLSKKPNKESLEHNTGRQSHRSSGHDDDPIVISDSDDALPRKRSKRMSSESSSSNEANSAPSRSMTIKILSQAPPHKKRTFSSSSSDRSNSASRSIPSSSAVSKNRGTALRKSVDSAREWKRDDEDEFDPEMYSRPNRRPDVRSSGIHDLKDCLNQRARWRNKDEVEFIS